jgi:hypothetical protein
MGGCPLFPRPDTAMPFVEHFGEFQECLHCEACFWGLEYIMVHSLDGVLVFVIARDSG